MARSEASCGAWCRASIDEKDPTVIELERGCNVESTPTSEGQPLNKGVFYCPLLASQGKIPPTRMRKTTPDGAPATVTQADLKGVERAETANLRKRCQQSRKIGQN